jgi:hypothetical protein
MKNKRWLTRKYFNRLRMVMCSNQISQSRAKIAEVEHSSYMRQCHEQF